MKTARLINISLVMSFGLGHSLIAQDEPVVEVQSESVIQVVAPEVVAQPVETLVPEKKLGLFEGADKDDAFDSWTGTQKRMLELWSLNSKSSKQMYNRAEDSKSRGYPLSIVMKGMFGDYNDWATAEMKKITSRISGNNQLRISTQMPTGLSAYHQALLNAQMLEELKTYEADLKKQPPKFGNTEYVFAPSAKMISRASSLMTQQLAAYSDDLSALAKSPEMAPVNVTIPGRNSKFTVQVDDSSERMRLFRVLLNSEKLKREVVMGSKGPEVVFTFAKKTDIDTPSRFYVKRAGETEVFKLKNTVDSRGFVDFMKAADAVQAKQVWDTFDYQAMTVNVSTPTLQKDKISTVVSLTSNNLKNEKIAIVNPHGNFIIGVDGARSFTKDDLEMAPFVVVNDLQEVLDASAILNAQEPKAPLNEDKPAELNEEEIIRRLRTGMLLPKSFDLSPLQCPRVALI